MADAPSPKYAVIIQWSDETHGFVASLPEWGPYCKAYGATYEEAAKNAREILQLLMEDEYGQPVDLPDPKLFHYPGADVINLPESAVGPQPKPGATPARQTA